MKLKSDRAVLATALRMGQRAVPGRPANAALTGVLLEAAEGGGLTLTTTGREVTARIAIEVQVEEPGTALVPARLLADTVKSLSDAPVELETDQMQLWLRSAAYEGSLRLLQAEDFPRIEEPSGTKVTVEAGAFAEAVSQLARAAAPYDSRPVLTGVLIEVSREGVVLVATDSYRLAIRELVATADQEARAVVPARALSEAARVAATDKTASVDVFVDELQSSFRIGPLTLTSWLIGGEFPNYRQLLPDAHDGRLIASRKGLIEAVRRVGLLAKGARPVRLEFHGSGVRLSSFSPDLGQAVETVEARYEGPELTVAFNPSYLADGLSAVSGETVRVDVGDGLKPGVVRGESDEFVYLVMPIRVRAADGG